MPHILRVNIKNEDVIILLSLLLMEFRIESVKLKNNNGFQLITGAVRQLFKVILVSKTSPMWLSLKKYFC
jgi:hypothetical protein